MSNEKREPVFTPDHGDNPIFPSIADEAIRELAYLKWEQAGRPEGRDQEFWFDAAHDLTYGY